MDSVFHRGSFYFGTTPRYGPQWEEFPDSGPVYARIEAERMFAIDVTAGASSGGTSR